MATTLSAAKAKLAAKIPDMPKNYNESMGMFFGVGAATIAGSSPGKAYAAKVKPGLENVWEANLKRRFGV